MPKRITDKTIYSSCNSVQLVRAGKHFFSFLEKLIAHAKHSIHFQTYIFGEDETGTAIADALIKAAKRDVQVYLLLDGYASQSLSRKFIKRLKDGGVHFRFFEPLLRSRYFYFGRRLHHKVVVVDGVKAVVGSQNIADRYNDLHGEPAWLDAAIYVEGEAALELHRICRRIWTKRASRAMEIPPGAKEHLAAIPKEKHCKVSIKRNDWVYGKHQVYKTYSSLFSRAHKSISIVCSYFLPGRTLMSKLKGAVKRGVKVKVVLTGVSDVKTAKYAERYLYRWMLRNKIEVYEYQRSVLHAKATVVDKKMITIGSYNLNELSAHASVELNLLIESKELGERAEERVQEIIEKDCERIDLQTYDTKLFSLKQFLQWGAFQFLWVLVKVVTFYYKRRE